MILEHNKTCIREGCKIKTFSWYCEKHYLEKEWSYGRYDILHWKEMPLFIVKYAFKRGYRYYMYKLKYIL